jgi:hypothetical protein
MRRAGVGVVPLVWGGGGRGEGEGGGGGGGTRQAAATAHARVPPACGGPEAAEAVRATTIMLGFARTTHAHAHTRAVRTMRACANGWAQVEGLMARQQAAAAELQDMLARREGEVTAQLMKQVRAGVNIYNIIE